MTQLTYPNDITGSIQTTQGSDGRLNVSSRSDSRGYYNSRDVGQCYSLVWDDSDCAVGDYMVYWQNTSTTQDLVIGSAGINSTVAGAFKLAFVTGTAATAGTLTPVNLNRSSAKDALANCLGGSAISGLTEDGVIDLALVQDNGHEEFRLGDRVRLGQNDAIAIEFDRSTVGNTIAEGVLFGFYEPTQ